MCYNAVWQEKVTFFWNITGDTSSVQEDIAHDDGVIKDRAVELYMIENGKKFSIRTWVHTIRRGACYTEAKVSDASISNPTIRLTDDVAPKWRAGRNYYVRVREKGRDLTQSYDKSPYTNRNVKMAKRQQKQRHKKVRLYSGCGPT